MGVKQKLISAQEIIKKYSITYQTVNHYTNFGLINVITKKSNVRLYDEEEVDRRLIKIIQLAGAGFPLRLIRKTLNDELAVKVNTGTGGA
ncbi:MAG: MerR family transcriptional regulator [Candidatus Omnitrophota bacterium]